jgi:hypothetical protein
VQGKINVVVGFVYPKYNKESAAALCRDSAFFNDFLGICGNVTDSRLQNAPYASKEAQALGLDATHSQPLKRKAKVLPIQFYEALVEAVACPPQQKGATCISHFFVLNNSLNIAIHTNLMFLVVAS